MIYISDLSKSFLMHSQGAALIEVMRGAPLSMPPGECVALTGASGTGKSTLMRLIYGNYLAGAGEIPVGDVDVGQASPREIIALRYETLGYGSQFLRVVPRVPTREVVAEPLLVFGVPEVDALDRAEALRVQFNLSERPCTLSLTTFSRGEQQRVNITRGFVHPYPSLLLDDPTASLDPVNREAAPGLIEAAKTRGAAIAGTFRNAAAMERVRDRTIDVGAFAPVAA